MQVSAKVPTKGCDTWLGKWLLVKESLLEPQATQSNEASGGREARLPGRRQHERRGEK